VLSGHDSTAALIISHHFQLSFLLSTNNLAMGTRGILGFITKGVRKGTFNHFDSYPSGLGDAIIKFILAHTDEELEQMVGKVEQVSSQLSLEGS
jgi:hypothetical protein